MRSALSTATPGPVSVLSSCPATPDRSTPEDGLWTHHGHAFIQEPDFQRAYARAVRAGGFDYGIRLRVHTLLWAARLASTVDGAFVECGTGRGFMASAICDYLGWTDRPFYLYDTFEPTWPDGAGDQTGAISPCYASSVVDVRRISRSGPASGSSLVGYRRSLPKTPRRGWPFCTSTSTMPHPSAAVRHFWPRMPPGACSSSTTTASRDSKRAEKQPMRWTRAGVLRARVADGAGRRHQVRPVRTGVG